MSEESSQPRNERTQKVRDLVWHMRAELAKNSVRVGDVASFLGKLDERRRELRARAQARESRPALDDALAELDSTQEEIRVVGEELDRRGEQLRAWEADAAAKLRFHRRLMERAPVAFFLTDENGLIADANEEAARMLGVPSSYLRNKPIVNFVNRRDVGNTRSFVRAVGQSDQVIEAVISFRPRGGGPVRVAQVRACALERRYERALGWIVREMREHAGSRDEGAEDRKTPVPSRSAPESEALATASHELRGPIQTIETALSLLRAALPPGSDGGRVAAHCDSILRASVAMTRMVTDLEDAARVEGGKLTLARSPCDLRRLVEELLSANQPRATRHGLSLAATLPHEAVLVEGDFVRLTQVVATFLDNALKLTPAGKTIRVVLDVHEGRARVDVIDEGHGISAADLEHVFDRRWQAEVSSGLGSGLGLRLARAIAQAHGGAVGVQSSPGAGSRFWVEVPLRRA